MAEEKSGADKYASNSQKDKQEPAEPEVRVEKVVEGVAVQRKKRLGRRFAEAFSIADGQSVGGYVLFSVIVPRLKDLIFDVGESALRQTLFGNSPTGYRSSSSGVKGYVPYNTISQGAVLKQAAGNKPAPTPASDEFGEIVVADRGEADQVMDKISNTIEKYGSASVSDLKAACGLTPTFTDEKFGWKTMGGTDVRRIGGPQPGYILIFPRPEEL